jgi:hypothetical protein
VVEVFDVVIMTYLPYFDPSHEELVSSVVSWDATAKGECTLLQVGIVSSFLSCFVYV